MAKIENNLVWKARNEKDNCMMDCILIFWGLDWVYSIQDQNSL